MREKNAWTIHSFCAPFTGVGYDQHVVQFTKFCYVLTICVKVGFDYSIESVMVEN